MSCTILCVEVGDKLKLARSYHQPALTQAKLAERLGVDTSTVGRWESKNHIPEDMLDRVAGVFSVPGEWFFDGGDEPPPATQLKEEEPNIRPKAQGDLSRSELSLRDYLMVAIPVWRGVMAGSDDECVFVEPSELEFREVPLYLTLGQPEKHVLCIASGVSMSPRIEHSERMLIRLDPDVPVGCLVVAKRADDGANFIKRLTRGQRNLELTSLNGAYAPITELNGWEIRGGVTVIWKRYEPGTPNLEWDDGRFLR